MDRVSDLVRDSELRTRFHSKYISHRYHDSSSRADERPTEKEEYWKREKLIGAGAYGRVWLEKCISGEHDNSFRAVKEIAKPRASRPKVDYNRELEALAKFSHQKYVRCFVKSFGWFQNAETLFIAMEYFPLGDLQQHISASSALVEVQAQQISHQLTEGLEILHENGFVHRDLKPSNVLIQSRPPHRWWVKIGDFGVSKRTDGRPATCSTLRGTLGYMAPELHGFVDASECFLDDGVAAACAADMWSLGETIFYMLTKEASFGNMGGLLAFVKQPQLFPYPVLQQRRISESGIELLVCLMNTSPKQRICAVDALNHNWMTSCRSASPKALSIVSIESLALQNEAPELDLALSSKPSAMWTSDFHGPISTNSVDGTNVPPINLSLRQVQQDGWHEYYDSANNTGMTVVDAGIRTARVSQLSSFSHPSSLRTPSEKAKRETVLPDLEHQDRSASLIAVDDLDTKYNRPRTDIDNLTESNAGSDMMNDRDAKIVGSVDKRSGAGLESYHVRNQGRDTSQKGGVVVPENFAGDNSQHAKTQSQSISRQVVLTDGNLVLDVPSTMGPITSILCQEPQDREFTHMRFTGATCKPSDFRKERYTLRPCLFHRPRHISLALGAVFNVPPNSVQFAKFLASVLATMSHLSEMSKIEDLHIERNWQSMALVLVFQWLDFDMRKAFKMLGFNINDVKDLQVVNGKPIKACIYEYSTKRTFRSHRNAGEPSFYGSHTSTDPVQIILCEIKASISSSDSEEWLKTITDFLEPRLRIRYDTNGSLPNPGLESLYRIWKSKSYPLNVKNTKEITYKSTMWERLVSQIT